MNEHKPKSTPTESMGKALAQGSTIGMQAGCVSVVLVILALVAGMWLDQTFNTQHLFVLGLLLLSVPVSLAAMVYTVLRSTRSMRSTPSDTTRKEDSTLE
jgi:F0F1-type ATP synthase assembly protein I